MSSGVVSPQPRIVRPSSTVIAGVTVPAGVMFIFSNQKHVSDHESIRPRYPSVRHSSTTILTYSRIQRSSTRNAGSSLTRPNSTTSRWHFPEDPEVVLESSKLLSPLAIFQIETCTYNTKLAWRGASCILYSQHYFENWTWSFTRPGKLLQTLQDRCWHTHQHPCSVDDLKHKAYFLPAYAGHLRARVEAKTS